MCGFFGLICDESELGSLRTRIDRAHAVQRHRGPDMQGEKVLSGPNGKVVYLAHQRLSILDLSAAGKQPMADHTSENWIAFNGEIYNYPELATQIGFKPIGGSDTEVILEYFRRFGVNASLPQFNGMWSLAWFSAADGALYLTRDRAGVKPLYYAHSEGRIYFASEIKTLLVLVGRRQRLNFQVIGEYLDQSLQDTSEATFFKDIRALTPGSFARINLADQSLAVLPVSYWDPFNSPPAASSVNDVVDQVREIFTDAVKLRLRADVPVGILLSGGVDSSIIAASVKKEVGDDGDITVLSAVSPGRPGDESIYIDQVSRHLNLRTTKVNTDWGPAESIELLRKVTWFNDSPLGSFSNVAFYLLMQRANEAGVKVLLSGQGGDELFCGYRKYLGFYLQELAAKRQFTELCSVGGAFAFNGGLRQFSLTEAKRYLQKTVDRDVLGPAMIDTYTAVYLGRGSEGMARRQWQDYRRFSVPYLTHYEDRASMAFSREVRLPFLDYRLVELMLNAPIDSKLGKGWTKYALRKAFADQLPKQIIWRKDKQGFSMPQEEWLRGDLKPVWLKMLHPQAQVFRRGILNHRGLMTKFDAFCAGKAVWYREIFAPLALEVWLEQFNEFIETV